MKKTNNNNFKTILKKKKIKKKSNLKSLSLQLGRKRPRAVELP